MCGERSDPEVAAGSALYMWGYTDEEHVVKF